VAARLFTRRLKPARPLGSPGRWVGSADRWLFERYGLGVLDRSRVSTAVFGKGQAPADRGLREPARDLAAEVLAGRLRVPRLPGLLGWVYAALGIIWLAAALVEGFVAHRRGVHFVLDSVFGAGYVVLGALSVVWIPRDMRRKAERVLATPDDPGHAGLSIFDG
jgi:hypothetical protein